MAHGKQTFTYEQALETFPRVRQLTAQAVAEVEALFASVTNKEDLEEKRQELRESYDRIVTDWAEAITRLGCEVKGLWLVDWDSGGGYYCWRHPEESIGYFHSYEDGFQGRMPIA
jgi:hypothetical protein